MRGDMTMEATKKVTASHLERRAFLYVRQSSPRQVLENTESGERQYALKQRAVALGWPMDQITVVDSDQGQSGESAADREGFQKLVTEVSMGRAGIVLGSRGIRCTVKATARLRTRNQRRSRWRSKAQISTPKKSLLYLRGRVVRNPQKLLTIKNREALCQAVTPCVVNFRGSTVPTK